LFGLSEKFEQHPGVKPLITELIAYLKPTKIESIHDAFYNLRLFFENKHPDYKHNQLKEKISLLGSRIQNNSPNKEEMRAIAQAIKSAFLTELLPPLNKINKVDILKTVPELEANLLSGKNSVRNNLGNVFKKFDAYNLIDPRSEIKAFSLLREFYAAIQHFQFTFFKKGSPFNSFCKKFPCRIYESIEVSWERATHEELNDFNVSFSNNVPKGILVDIHSSYLEYSLIELFKNALKEPGNKNAILSLSVLENSAYIQLIIHQDKPFCTPKDRHQGGVEKFVIPIFEQFCGMDSMTFQKKGDAYIIEIKFPNTIKSIENEDQ
jgi:hypothetical protein